MLEEKSCVVKCSSNYFQRHTICIKCHPSCKTCRGPTNHDCIECQDNLYKQEQEQGSDDRVPVPYHYCTDWCKDNYVPYQGKCINDLGSIKITGNIHEKTGKISHMESI